MVRCLTLLTSEIEIQELFPQETLMAGALVHIIVLSVAQVDHGKQDT